MIRKMPSVKKPRSWACAHCPRKNLSTKKKCGGCGIGRKTKRTSLKARCDAMARELCRLLADGKCARCAGPGSDWAHRAVRRHHSVRWDVVGNSDFLCRSCHNYFGSHPFAFVAWLKAKGVDVDELERRANEAWDKSYERVLSELSTQLAAARAKAA